MRRAQNDATLILACPASESSDGFTHTRVLSAFQTGTEPSIALLRPDLPKLVVFAVHLCYQRDGCKPILKFDIAPVTHYPSYTKP